jgi:DNA repair protein RecO (recombination protein O)
LTALQWQDEGVVLAARRHGESSAVISVFTPTHGRHAGLVRGGASRRARSVYEAGNRVRVTWRARLPEQLGSFSAELDVAVAARLLDDPGRLAGLGAACALLETTLPERDPHPILYNMFSDLLDLLPENKDWLACYVRFELELLAELGFGLDLSACAVTGAATDLVYVSPRTGRAVSRAGAGVWADRLLPLPGFLLGQGPADPAQIRAGLRLTGAFLRRHLFDASERPMPSARERLVRRLAQSTDGSPAA